jgi:hypothetical protein
VGPPRARIVRLGPGPARGLRRTVSRQTAQARVRLHRATAALTALTSRSRARVRRVTATIARRTQMAGAALMSRRRVRAATGLPIRRPTPHRHATIPRLHVPTRPRVAVTLRLRTRHLRARTLRRAVVIPRPAVAMAAVAAAEVTTAVVVAAGDRTIAAAVAVRTAAVIPTDANST